VKTIKRQTKATQGCMNRPTCKSKWPRTCAAA